MRENAGTATGAGSPLIGVLALQGDFAAHVAVLERLGAATRLVRTPADLELLDGLVMPGGESTTMLKHLEHNGLGTALAGFVAERPTFGTCAGLILLAREVTSPEQPSLGVLDVGVERNAYGRQIESFVAEIDAPVFGCKVEGVFIRAPRIRRVGPGVTVLGRLGDEVVLVEQGHLLGATFHPELTAETRIHGYFLERVAARPRSGRRAAA